MLAGLGRGDGALWVGAGEVTTVGNLQRAEGEERGSWACSSSSPPFLTARVGAEGAGIDRGDVQEHGYRVKTNGNRIFHSEFNFSGFLPTRCSTHCPQEFIFRIFENGHCGLSRYFTRIPKLFLF
jgi:hypothetical protein